MEELLTTEELAGRLNVKPGNVRQWQRRGLVPAVKLSPKGVAIRLRRGAAGAEDAQQKGGGR